MSRLNAVGIIIFRELIRYVRDRARIFTTLFQPLLFLVVFGTGFRQTLASSNLGVDFVQFMFPGIVAMSIVGTAFFSTISTVWDREFGFLKEILVAPVPRTSIAVGKTVGAVIIASIQALLLLLVGPLIGVAIHPAVIPGLILIMLLLSFAIAGLGLLFASLVRTIENFGLIMNLLVFPMFFLSGAFFPLTAVPYWMVVLSRFDPLAYGVDAFRQLLLRPQVPAEVIARFSIFPISINLLILAVFSVVMIGAAVLAFNRRG